MLNGGTLMKASFNIQPFSIHFNIQHSAFPSGITAHYG